MILQERTLSIGIKEENIIMIALDEVKNAEFRDALALSKFISSKVIDKSQMYYVFIDEIQYAIKKEELKSEDPLPLYGALNEFLHLGNVDVYVTGSNSKLLSKDVMTEFRGRGDEVRVYPLTFKEYYDFIGGDKVDKMKYLTDLFKKKQCEIDFVVNMGPERYYIQSAYSMNNEMKEKSELCSLLATKDYFKKIVITFPR